MVPFVGRTEMDYEDTVVLVERTGVGKTGWIRDGMEGEWKRQNLLLLLGLWLQSHKTDVIAQKIYSKGD